MARPRAQRRDAFDLSELQPVTTLVEQAHVELFYDYDRLPEAERPRAIQAAQTIKPRLKRSAEDIFVIGAELNAVKDAFPHGEFSAWLDAEFGLSQRMAQRFMSVAARLIHKSDKLSLLSPSVLYLLAAPSTPAAAIVQVEALLDAGEHPPLTHVTQIVEESRVQARMAPRGPLGTRHRKKPLRIRRRAQTPAGLQEARLLARSLSEAARYLERGPAQAWEHLFGDRRLIQVHSQILKLMVDVMDAIGEDMNTIVRLTEPDDTDTSEADPTTEPE